MAYLTGFTDQMSSLDPTKNIIDVGSQFASFVVLGASQSFPFFFFSGIPSIFGLALAKDLTIPKYGLVFILGSLLTTVATIPGNYSAQVATQLTLNWHVRNLVCLLLQLYCIFSHL